MKYSLLPLTLSVALVAGCGSLDRTDKSTLSTAAIGAIGAYPAGAIDPREAGNHSDGFLYGQHQQAAGRL